MKLMTLSQQPLHMEGLQQLTSLVEQEATIACLFCSPCCQVWVKDWVGVHSHSQPRGLGGM